MTRKIIIIIHLLLSLVGIAQSDAVVEKKIDSLEVVLLKEVVVDGTKKIFERKADRLVFNVENSIMAKGVDALEALKITPRLKIKEDAITMSGKSDMGLMVNGKMIELQGIDLINYLKSIPSERIKSIEVIPTPPAQYSAEGNSGLVNIVLKKAKNDSWNASIRQNTTQATYLSGGVGGSFSYQKNKLSILTDINTGKNKVIYTNDVRYLYPSEEYWKTDMRNRNLSEFVTPSLTLGYEINPKLTLGFQYNGTVNNKEATEENQIFIYDNKSLQKLNKLFNTSGKSIENQDNHFFNLSTTKKIDTLGKKYSIDVDYFTIKNNKANPFNTTNTLYLTNQQNEYYTINKGTNTIENFSAKIDFQMPYSWATMNYGGRSSFSIAKNRVNGNFYETTNAVENLYLTQNNDLNYKENNQALYFSIEKKLNEKWSSQLGLRMEATQNEGSSRQNLLGVISDSINKQNYAKLFPTFYLVYEPNNNHSFSASISRRIKRPNYWELNPARWYQSLNSYVIGNPYLQPSFTYNAELYYGYKNILNTTVWASKSENNFGQLTTHNNENVIFIRENYFDYVNTGIDQNLAFNIFKWWYTSNNFSVYYYESNTLAEFTNYLAPSFSGGGAYIDTYNSINFNKKKTFSTQIFYSYNFPSRWAESQRSAYSTLNIGFRYKMLNDKLQLNLSFNNILRSDIQTLSNKTQGVSQSFKQYYDTQLIRFSVSYSFGNKNIKINKLEGGNQDEKQRTN